MDLKSLVRTIPDYPKAGILFRDITTLLKDPQGLREVVELFAHRYQDKNIDYIAGIEARGFILGAALAFRLNKGFVPIRKKGKLPGEVVGRDYQLEYGVDRVEIHSDALEKNSKILLVDDLLATGGTALASMELIRSIGSEVVECAFVIDLPDLKGAEKLKESGATIFTLIEFEGD